MYLTEQLIESLSTGNVRIFVEQEVLLVVWIIIRVASEYRIDSEKHVNKKRGKRGEKRKLILMVIHFNIFIIHFSIFVIHVNIFVTFKYIVNFFTYF